MCQIFATCYNTLSILTRYGHKWYNNLIFFYSIFSLLCLHFIHLFSLSFFLRHQASPFFSSQSRCFSLFLSYITLSFFFSLFSSFTLISVAMVFFFFLFFFYSDLIPSLAMGGLRWWLADHWCWVAMVRFSGGWVGLWVGGMVMGESVVVGSIVRNRWWEDRPMNGFWRMDRRWMGWQWQWVGV